MDKYTIMAGAGVSVDSPSSFPMAVPIINSIINSLAPNDSIKDDLLKKDVREGIDQKYKLSGDFLRFEMLIDAISFVDKKLKVLDIIKNYKNPNLNHYNLAKLAIDGNYVFTPNFDDLIERAIYNMGYVPQTICSKNDYETYKFQRNKTIPVFKLHGSYYTYIGKGNKKKLTRETIQASLTSIISENKSLLLDSYKTKVLTKCIKNSTKMIFVGYSGSDDFDIVPSLMEISIGNLLWINHNEKINANNVVDGYLTGSGGRSSLLKKQYEIAQDSVELYDTNTREFLSNVGGVKKIQIYKEFHTSIPYEEYFSNWSELFTQDEKLYILGRVYQGLDFYDKASELYSQISKKSKYYIDSQLQLCVCLDQRSKYKEALCVNKSLKEYKNINRKKEYLNIIGGEAYLRYRIYGNEDGLESVFKKLINKAGERYSLLQITMNNYALFLRDLGRTKESASLFKLSFKYAVKQGDLQRQTWAECNMANLLYDKGYIDKAELWAGAGINHAEILGDHRQVGVFENLFANIYFIRGNFDKAIEYCENSINRDKYLGNDEDSSVNELLLGQCYFDKEDYKMAMSHYDESLKLFRRSDDKSYLYELLFYLIVYNLKTNAVFEAQKNLEQLYICVNKKETGIDHLLYKISDKMVDIFISGNKRSFKDDLRLFLKDKNSIEIIAYINIVWYLAVLEIPVCLIGKQHIVKASKIFFRYGNMRKYEYLDSLI